MPSWLKSREKTDTRAINPILHVILGRAKVLGYIFTKTPTTTNTALHDTSTSARSPLA
jgi:hypothetical protein